LGNESLTLNAIRNKNLAKLLKDQAALKPRPEPPLTIREAANGHPSAETGSEDREKEELSPESSPPTVGFCTRALTRCSWFITSCLLGLSMEEGIKEDENDKEMTTRCWWWWYGQSEDPDYKQKKKPGHPSACSCKQIFRNTLKLCWDCGRLAAIFFVLAFIFTRFLMVIIKESKHTDIQAKNATCSSIPFFIQTKAPVGSTLMGYPGPFPSYNCSYTGNDHRYREACMLRTTCRLHELDEIYTT